LIDWFSDFARRRSGRALTKRALSGTQRIGGVEVDVPTAAKVMGEKSKTIHEITRKGTKRTSG
jgi:hypothetical protein